MQKITATNLAELVIQLNQNFSELLASPIFKGLFGDIGDDGPPGVIGTRGSLWTFIDIDELNSQFGTTYTDVTLTLDILQSLVISDLSKVIAATTLSSLILNDILLLPNGGVVIWDGINFVDSGIDLVTPNEAVSYQQVLTILEEYALSVTSTNKVYQMAHKKYKDTSVDADLNSQGIYPDSTLDILSEASGLGVLDDNTVTIGLREELGEHEGTKQKLMHVSGHIPELHDIIQNALFHSLIAFGRNNI